MPGSVPRGQNVVFPASGLTFCTPATPSANLDSGNSHRDFPAAPTGVTLNKNSNVLISSADRRTYDSGQAMGEDHPAVALEEIDALDNLAFAN